jgi:pimeloyl-ACP methyl ester carboxylesterase
MSLRYVLSLATLLTLGWAGSAAAQSEPPSEPPADWGVTAIDFSNVPYPYSVEFVDVEVYGRQLRMAYMDVAPVGTPNGQTIVLFHGFNFGMYAFGETMEILRNAGFRTIAIDRLGFGRSSKPIMHYNLHVPARNTQRLLDHLGIEQAAILGHSQGGMVASRGERPTPQQYYRQILGSQMRYYVQGWRPEYLKWVEAPYGLIFSAAFDRWLEVRGLLGQAMWEDPVVYDWQHISSKALVIGGADDPLSRDFAADARRVAESLQNAELLLYRASGTTPSSRTRSSSTPT